MTTQDDQSLLSARQERRWFRVWTAALVVFFVGAGVTSLGFLWTNKQAEADRHRRLLDAAAPDPGVTAAEDISAKEAISVEAGIYVERVPELAARDATWTADFDVWFRWRGDDLKPADGLVVMEGTVESKEKLAEFHQDGNHYERYRIVAKITKAFPAARVPFDSHLLVLALQTDQTRVATAILGHMGDTYKESNFSDSYHGYTHKISEAGGQIGMASLDQLRIGHVAYLLGKMKAVKEADGSTLLDNSLVHFGAGMGTWHESTDALPEN
jgi:hypothetical protein